MCPKRYMSLWYVWRKPCTYLALTLRPSPNRPNETPHDSRHIGVPKGVSKTISEPMVRFDMIPLGFVSDLSMRGVG